MIEFGTASMTAFAAIVAASMPAIAAIVAQN